jgi:hypothetical protein
MKFIYILKNKTELKIIQPHYNQNTFYIRVSYLISIDFLNKVLLVFLQNFSPNI